MIVLLAIPVLLLFAALVIEGGNLVVKKRQIQTASDAAALAVAQDLNKPGCDIVCVGNLASQWSNKNGGDALHECADSSDYDCYSWPYKGNDKLVEVRLRKAVSSLFAGLLGASWNVAARAVASATPELGTVTVAGTTDPGSTDPNVTITGPGTVSTDPDLVLGGSGIAFTMSRNCNAITYQGAGSGTAVLGSFATNGGMDIKGNKPKKVTTLYYNKPGCPTNPPIPPSGTSACTAVAWGDATDSNELCVKTLVDLNVNSTLPINWPIAPPVPPTPLPTGTTWNPSIHYPSSCINLGSSSMTFSTTGRPPAIYCISGASTILTITSNASAGDGYTFFALGGAKINVAGNGTTLKFYWPSACGARPTTRPSSFLCAAFSRTLWTGSSYDPLALLYATNQTNDFTACLTNAVCLNGQNGNLTGDIFAPSPSTFPPGPTQNGGTVAIEGGALSAGSGFIESWNLSIKGNTGSYTGTGSPIVVPGGTHTTPGGTTVITGTVHLGTTDPGNTNTVTTGTTLGLDE